MRLSRKYNMNVCNITTTHNGIHIYVYVATDVMCTCIIIIDTGAFPSIWFVDKISNSYCVKRKTDFFFVPCIWWKVGCFFSSSLVCTQEMTFEKLTVGIPIPLRQNTEPSFAPRITYLQHSVYIRMYIDGSKYVHSYYILATSLSYSLARLCIKRYSTYT